MADIPPNPARGASAGGTAAAGGASGSSPEAPRSRAQDRRQALRRATYLALAIAAVALSVRAVVGKRGLLEAHRARRALARLEAEVGKWKERNASLEERIKALRDDPATIEAIARERLGWIRPGEITFLFPHDPAAPEPGDPAPIPPGEFSPTLGDETPDSSGDAPPADGKP